MNRINKAIVGMFVLFLFGTLSVFANGQGESSNLSGTITSIQPAASGSVTVTLSSQGTTYSVTLNQSVVTQAALQVGQNISLEGVLHRTVNGEKDIQAATFQVNGVTYTIDHPDAKASSDSKSNSTPEAEKPEPTQTDKPDASSSHDSGTSHDN